MGAGSLGKNWGRILPFAGALLALAVVAVSTGPDRATAAAGGCAHATDTHADASLKQLTDATICLINRERSQRDRRRLDESAKLKEAAARHTSVMLRTDCLDHTCPGERGLRKRIKKTGYLKGATRRRFAESTGCKNTPRGMVEAWMARRFHRRNLLERSYRDVGTGLGRGSPNVGGCKGNPDLTTFTVLVAFRRP
jgi:uncharacterized protein YkwD